MGVETAIQMHAASEFEAWLAAHHADERELWIAVYTKASKRQTVGFDELLDVALCWGWVDVMTKKIDADRYGIRFVPRRPDSNWAATNRARVCRLLAAGRMHPSGTARLPADLVCDSFEESSNP